MKTVVVWKLNKMTNIDWTTTVTLKYTETKSPLIFYIYDYFLPITGAIKQHVYLIRKINMMIICNLYNDPVKY